MTEREESAERRPDEPMPGEPTAPAGRQIEPRQAEPPPLPAVDEGLERTRTSTVWTSVVVAAVVLLLLLVFILQNDQDVKVAYLGGEGTLPLGVALLFAAVGGALLVVLVGAARILQLRRVSRRQRRSVTGETGAGHAP